MGKALIGNIKLFDINTAACFNQKIRTEFSILYLSVLFAIIKLVYNRKLGFENKITLDSS